MLDRTGGNYVLRHRQAGMSQYDVNITPIIKERNPDWEVTFLTCDFPYIFVSYKHKITEEHYSGFFVNIIDNNEFIEYNPFAYLGRNSNVEYLSCKWNDKTGLGVVVKDYNDIKDNAPVIKELGWTPDTLLIYPAPWLATF